MDHPFSKVGTCLFGRALPSLALALILSACDNGEIAGREGSTSFRTADATGASLPAAAAGLSGWSRTGAYLAGLSAFENRDMEKAADLLPLALAEDLGNPILANQTLYALLSAGRIEGGIDLARNLRAKGQSSALIALALVQDSARKNDFAAAAKAASDLPDDRLLSIAGPMLRAWAELGANGLGAGLRALEPLNDIVGADGLRLIQAALIQDQANERQGAARSFDEAVATVPKLSTQVVEFAVDFLHRQGKLAEARALIARYREQGAGQTDEVADAIQARLEKAPDQRPITEDPKQGMAVALAQIAMELVAEGLFGDALWLAQLSLDLDPGLDVARLALGDIHRENRHHDLAIAAYDGIDSGSIFFRASRLSTAESLRLLERADAAERLLRDLIAGGSDGAAAIQLGNLLRVEKKFKESAEAYGMAIKHLGEPRREDWQLFYYRGIAHERSGDWPPAEADFKRALELSPDEPYVLNYLAYTWVERREHLDQALRMLEKAVGDRPEEGFIVDSLGWAHYQLGNFDKAVGSLERAVELSPTDPVLNDHLGDALWRVGREQEARFQWRRALSFEPEPDLVPAIEAKLKDGLPPPASQPPSTAEGNGG